MPGTATNRSRLPRWRFGPWGRCYWRQLCRVPRCREPVLRDERGWRVLFADERGWWCFACTAHRRPWLREVNRRRAARTGLLNRKRREKVQERADQALRGRGICGDDAIDECIAEAEAARERVRAEDLAPIDRLLAEDAADNLRFLSAVRMGRV